VAAREIAIATPGSVSEMRRASATEPTTPVANAARRSIRRGLTRAATCELVAATTSPTTAKPISQPIRIAVDAPATTNASERIRFTRSASTTESIVAWIGSISGATIIAPMTVAVESPTTPARRHRRQDQQDQKRLRRRNSGPSKNTDSRMRAISAAATLGMGVLSVDRPRQLDRPWRA
jgi:hypothetical protein